MIKEEFIEIFKEFLDMDGEVEFKPKEINERTVALLVIANEMKQIKDILQNQNDQLDRLNDTLDSITMMAPKGNSFLNVVASVYEN